MCIRDRTECLTDPAFARLVMNPKKKIVNCFHYINRKAREYLEQEMKDNDEKPMGGGFGGDVPDELCYQWAREYFRDADVKELSLIHIFLANGSPTKCSGLPEVTPCGLPIEDNQIYLAPLLPGGSSLRRSGVSSRICIPQIRPSKPTAGSKMPAVRLPKLIVHRPASS